MFLSVKASNATIKWQSQWQNKFSLTHLKNVSNPSSFKRKSSPVWNLKRKSGLRENKPLDIEELKKSFDKLKLDTSFEQFYSNLLKEYELTNQKFSNKSIKFYRSL